MIIIVIIATSNQTIQANQVSFKINIKGKCKATATQLHVQADSAKRVHWDTLYSREHSLSLSSVDSLVSARYASYKLTISYIVGCLILGRQ